MFRFRTSILCNRLPFHNFRRIPHLNLILNHFEQLFTGDPPIRLQPKHLPKDPNDPFGSPLGLAPHPLQHLLPYPTLPHPLHHPRNVKLRQRHFFNILLKHPIILQTLQQAVPIEKRITPEVHLKGQHAQRPHVDCFGVGVVFRCISEDFGGEVGFGADEGVGQVVLFGDAEVGDFVAAGDADCVLGFYVAVDDVLLVDVVQAAGQVVQDVEEVGFAQGAVFGALDEGGEGTLA